MKIKNIGILLAALSVGALCGCVSATATHTANGATDSIKVTGFLETIANGDYTNGTGMSLSVNSATPDEQAISTLSSGVVQLGSAAMALMAKPPTNSVPVVATNAPALKQP